MTSALLTELLRSLGVLSMLLLLGTFLRAKVPVFQKIFLPASVIGGFIGLLLGPRIWGANNPLSLLQVTDDWINIWSLLPGILIVPIFAAVPLGMFTDKKEGGPKVSAKKSTSLVLISCGLFGGLACFQQLIGFATHLGYDLAGKADGFYRTFGYELSQGFAGGHGTAGAVGRILEGFGEPYWETAQGVTSTTATIGLIGGMIIGIFMINWAARHGKTSVMKNPEDIPQELKVGFTKDKSKQGSLGRETTYGSSIETITFHAALILVAVAIGYYLRGLMVSTGVEAFTSLPVWFYGLFAMFVLDFVLSKLKLGWAIDSKVRSKITGTLSDIAITAAIASIPIQAVMAYIGPIIVMCILGFILSWLFVFKLYPIFYGDNAPFEHAIIAWGTGTGVMINGMMLLKICDPDYESPALVNFSMGFSLMGMLNLAIALYTMPVLKNGNIAELTLKHGLVPFLIYVAIAIVGLLLIRSSSKEAPKTA